MEQPSGSWAAAHRAGRRTGPIRPVRSPRRSGRTRGPRILGAGIHAIVPYARADSSYRIAKVVKVNGYVNVAPDFTDIPSVINGCSDRLVEVLGERGRHARAALGVASLPAGSSVEVEMIVEIA